MSGAYFASLIEMIDGGSYILLLKELNKEHFYPTHYMDENRVQEVKETLREFLPCPPRTPYVTIFEIMVLLAYKYEELNKKYGEPDRTATYFWMFMTNCGLNRYDDLYFKEHREESINKVHQWCSIFNNRTYGRDGTGSPFPLAKPPCDMRKTELFYQLCYYYNENN